MGTQTDYFNKIGYTGKYQIGDRVIGKWNKIPFVATVGNDRQLNERDGPEIHVHLDLPIKYKGVVYNFLVVKHKDVKAFK